MFTWPAAGFRCRQAGFQHIFRLIADHQLKLVAKQHLLSFIVLSSGKTAGGRVPSCLRNPPRRLFPRCAAPRIEETIR